MLVFKDVCKGYNDNKLIENCSFDLPRNAIVGVIGPNGIGKTTLFRMITGQEQPDTGAIDMGQTVSIGYVDQHRDALDNQKTIFEEITDGKDTIVVGGVTVPSRAYVARFNFKGAAQQNVPAVNATGFIWQKCCGGAAISSCWMSRPMISMSIRFACSNNPFWIFRAV